MLVRLAPWSRQELKRQDAVTTNFSSMSKEFDMNAEAPVKPGADGNYEIAIPGQWKLPWG